MKNYGEEGGATCLLKQINGKQKRKIKISSSKRQNPPVFEAQKDKE